MLFDSVALPCRRIISSLFAGDEKFKTRSIPGISPIIEPLLMADLIDGCCRIPRAAILEMSAVIATRAQCFKYCLLQRPRKRTMRLKSDREARSLPALVLENHGYRVRRRVGRHGEGM